MMKSSQYIAMLLMVVYGVVFAHNIIPHHHHEVEKACALSDILEDDVIQDHHHHDEAHSCEAIHQDNEVLAEKHTHKEHIPCHFEVRPVVSKITSISMEFVVCEIYKLEVPLSNSVCNYQSYSAHTYIGKYTSLAPLRGPPTFS